MPILSQFKDFSQYKGFAMSRLEESDIAFVVGALRQDNLLIDNDLYDNFLFPLLHK